MRLLEASLPAGHGCRPGPSPDSSTALRAFLCKPCSYGLQGCLIKVSVVENHIHKGAILGQQNLEL